MEYIQCTHCGKRYAVSDQIRESEGQFTTCKSCKEKFLMIIHDSEAAKLDNDDSVISTGGWDPSLTMPDEEDRGASGEAGDSEEHLLDDDDGAQVLAALQAARKKKKRLYILSGLTAAVLISSLWLTFMVEDPIAPPATESMSQKVKKQAESAKVQDANNDACKNAAAQQWLIDYKAMHADYTGDEFVRLVKLSGQQTEKVKAACKSLTIIKDIITAATAKEKPSWFKTEIEVMQANR
ncbi:MAG: hypothetical protein R8M46_07605 [Ghiorsea sp.]